MIAEKYIVEIGELLKDGFQISDILRAAEIGAVAVAELTLLSGDEKRQLIKDTIVKAIEDNDQFWPVVGPWMDFPWVNQAQKVVEEWGIDQALNALSDAGFRKARFAAVSAGNTALAVALGVK
jgi:hypothetical protein